MNLEAAANLSETPFPDHLKACFPSSLKKLLTVKRLSRRVMRHILGKSKTKIDCGSARMLTGNYRNRVNRSCYFPEGVQPKSWRVCVRMNVASWTIFSSVMWARSLLPGQDRPSVFSNNFNSCNVAYFKHEFSL